MQTFTSGFNLVIGIFTVAAQILAIVAIIGMSFREVPNFLKPLVGFLTRKAILVAFVAALVATLGSLTYSDIIGYDPCKLCWIQRIFMYPLVIILGMGLLRKENFVRIYGIVLAKIGALIALFHYAGQLGWNPLGLECLAIGYSASCAKNFVLQFGYLTIPLMAFSAFALITFVLSLSIVSERKEIAAK